MDAPAISLRGVSKRFRRSGRESGTPWWRPRAGWKQALHPLDLEVEIGSVTGVIGPNGSGKSTLVRILGTLLLPDTGSAAVFGHDVVREPHLVRRHLNRVSVEAAFFKELSPWENMQYAARLYGGGGPGTRARVEAILSRLGLPLDTLDRPLKQLSRGQQQKVAIARSFLTSPSLLLMDEPTTGLDPRSKREVQEMVGRLRGERTVTVLLCTHDLAEAETLCDRVLMLDEGRVLADASPAELRRREGDISLEEVFLRLTGKVYEAEKEEEEVPA
ncbi:MAG TPA: ABC transporter ATP-binding protein [Candidatus Acidoferrales bacterium]|nr:ABC transporter ATP-binding protein [Candidatus Acidoferrales bacterium]